MIMLQPSLYLYHRAKTDWRFFFVAHLIRLSFYISQSGPSRLMPLETKGRGGVGSEFNQYKRPEPERRPLCEGLPLWRGRYNGKGQRSAASWRVNS